MLIVGFEENAEAVAWQCGQISQALGGDTWSDHKADQAYGKLREAAGLAATTSFKATMLSSNVASFIEHFSRYPIRIIARAGSGIVYGLLDEPLPESAWREIQSATLRGQGFLHVRGELPPFLPRVSPARGPVPL